MDDQPGGAGAGGGPLTAGSEPDREAAAAPAEGRLAAVFWHEKRRHGWTMPRRLRLVAVCGEVGLDFREAIVGPGVSEIVLSAWLSQLELVVPPWLRIDVDEGIAVTWKGGAAPPGPASPGPAPLLTVRIMGSAVGCEITVRPAPL